MRFLPRRAALLLLCLPGCYVWRPREIQPGAPPAVSGKNLVRVTRADGRVLTLARARVVGDSLVGLDNRHYRRTAVALAGARRVEEHHIEPTLTTLAVIVGGLAALVGGVAIADGTGG